MIEPRIVDTFPALRGADLTERQRAEEAEHALVAEHAARREAEVTAERFRFLSEAGALLAASLDEEAVVDNLAHLGVAMLADWCAVHLVDSAGRVRRAAVASDDPRLEAADTDRRDARYGELVAKVLDSGRTVLEPPPDTTRSMEAGPRFCVPLIAHGRCLGAVVFVATDPARRGYGPSDAALGEELARHAASALTNARLYAELGKQEAQVATILESISDAFFAVDHAWRFTYVNREAQRLMRRSARELLGKRLWEEFAPGDDFRFATELQRAMRERVTVSFVERYTPYHAWVEVRAFPRPTASRCTSVT